MKTSNPPPSGPSPFAIQDELPANFLERARASTCYGALRFVLAALTAGMLVVILATAVIYARPFLPFHDPGDAAGQIVTQGDPGLRWAYLIGIACLAVIASVIAVASYQGSLLLVDIADILIEQNRRRAPIQE